MSHNIRGKTKWDWTQPGCYHVTMATDKLSAMRWFAFDRFLIVRSGRVVIGQRMTAGGEVVSS